MSVYSLAIPYRIMKINKFNSEFYINTLELYPNYSKASRNWEGSNLLNFKISLESSGKSSVRTTPIYERIINY